MGQSTDGILFYGLCWSEEGEPYVPRLDDEPEGDDENEYEEDGSAPVFGGEEDFDDLLCRRLGGPKKPGWDDARRAFDGDLGTYWKQRDAFLVQTLGAKVSDVLHCSGNYPLWGLAVDSTKTVAKRGYPEQIMDLAVPEGSDEALRRACGALGLYFDAEVAAGHLGWWLVSLWW